MKLPAAVGYQPVAEFCDSAGMMHAEDLVVKAPDVDGWTTVQMKFRNSGCLWHGNPLCPAIDATVKYRPNAADPSGTGYEIAFIRDGMPSMGAYLRNPANTGWMTIKEDSQKVHTAITAIMALSGAVWNSVWNYPPPPEPPEGCYRQ